MVAVIGRTIMMIVIPTSNLIPAIQSSVGSNILSMVSNSMIFQIPLPPNHLIFLNNARKAREGRVHEAFLSNDN